MPLLPRAPSHSFPPTRGHAFAHLGSFVHLSAHFDNPHLRLPHSPQSVPHSETTHREDSSAMDQPFDPMELFKAEVRRKAQADGMSPEEAEVLASLALDTLRAKAATKRPGSPVTKAEVAEGVRKHAIREVEKSNARKEKLMMQGLTLIGSMTQEQLDEFMENYDGDEIGNDDEDSDEGEECRAIGTEKHGNLGRETKRFAFEDDGLEEVFGDDEDDPYDLCADMANLHLGMRRDGMDLITALCQRVELTVELAKHLRPEDLLTLYSTSRAFYQAFNAHALSVIRQIIAYKAPEAGRVFAFKMYRRHLINDPAGRVWGVQMSEAERRACGDMAKQVRTVPGVRYLQLVLTRDRCCREILAVMARLGHRTPAGTLDALLRLWLTMEVGVSSQRQAMMGSRDLWRDADLYNVQLFFVKLIMVFNEPGFGARKPEILHILLGRRYGLVFLWEVLLRKRWTTAAEIMQAKVAYRTAMRSIGRNVNGDKPAFGVPLDDVSQGHTEGWGLSFNPLLRPDELVATESLQRGLDLHMHLRFMAVWGYWDWFTGDNLVPTEDEMYVEDEETALAHMDTSHHWKKKHALKKRWASLTPEQQRKIREADEGERLMALAWLGSSSSSSSSSSSEQQQQQQPASEGEGEGDGMGSSADGAAPQPAKLDDEITRGIIVHKPKSKLKPPRTTDSLAAWVEFSSKALSGGAQRPPTGDQGLRAQALHSHGAATEEWDWLDWLQREFDYEDARTAASTAAAAAQEDAEMADGYDDEASPVSDEYDSEWSDDNDEDMESNEEMDGIIAEVLARANGPGDVVMADDRGNTGVAQDIHSQQYGEADMTDDGSDQMLQSGQDLQDFVNGFFKGTDL
ncbi:hypothetical protein JDV02_005108 [Purpureocillium takamizusanense]|uniref:Uncharacterized protein n=1 Tax=Purpureocillium takamizusanense TaxID=2060973 RepID=A0A9Q8QFW8_9HYPO|nr:uncharacterized protein JDV02_005108 [Purpureocillium takamizusanense]UNI18868.1 hypothetical protein JDV02_005108 [Purpureocillium takamizusanense]